MLKDLVKLANDLDSAGLIAEADYLDKIIKESGLLESFKNIFSKKDRLRAEIELIEKKLSSFPNWADCNPEEEEQSTALYKELFKKRKALHEIDPKKEPFKSQEEREILISAMESYIKNTGVYDGLDDNQKNRIKIISLEWKFDDYDYFWIVQIKEPDSDNPDDSDKDKIYEWNIWYGKADENIYGGPTKEFEINGEKYHLAGES